MPNIPFFIVNLWRSCEILVMGLVSGCVLERKVPRVLLMGAHAVRARVSNQHASLASSQIESHALETVDCQAFNASIVSFNLPLGVL